MLPNTLLCSLAPKNITLTPKNHTEVTVRWEEPSDRDPMDVYAAYIAGSGVKQCTAENGSVECTISGLLPRIPYNVCVRNCHPKLATAVSASPFFGGARLVSSGDLLEVATMAETDQYICSNAECDSVTLPMKGEKYRLIDLHTIWFINGNQWCIFLATKVRYQKTCF